jgi:hypothetical protein
LIVYVPSNVEWQQVGNRRKALYKVEFSTVDNRRLSSSTGWCWVDDIRSYAAQIVSEATKAARKLR